MISQFSPRFRWRTGAAVFLLCLAAILAACQSTDPQLTATAVYIEAQSEIESLSSTATVARARMQTTLDHAATRVERAEEAGRFLRSNLINLGTDTGFIDDSLRQLEAVSTQSPPTIGARANTAPAADRVSPTITPITIVTPPAATSAETSSVDGPRLENIVMASGVDSNDCAIDANPRFTPQSAAIYVVGRAFNIPAGASIRSIWRRSGLEVVRFSFNREYQINDSCIWFFIDQTDTPFTPGSWSVEILVEGAPVSSPLAFQIVNN
ncbi:MAG: hypothetical protein OXG85_15745 [Chloroflexi bacterium]|nr:hypothetical protein [Chloroflexota bacterium]